MHALLDQEEHAARQMLATLTRDFTGIVDASADSNADDEHDPEAPRSRSSGRRSAH